MCKHFFALLTLVAISLAGLSAQEKGKSGSDKAPAKDEMTKIELSFATEHVPDGLKAKQRVDLKRVDGKTVAPTGKAFYKLGNVVGDLEVVSVTKVDKPKDPEQAVKVELRVTKDQATKIEKQKSATVNVVETKPGGVPESKKKPVTLRLELVPTPEKK